MEQQPEKMPHSLNVNRADNFYSIEIYNYVGVRRFCFFIFFIFVVAFEAKKTLRQVITGETGEYEREAPTFSDCVSLLATIVLHVFAIGL